jgi:hypothetical protein
LSAFKSTARNRGDGVIACDGFAAIERDTKGGAGRSEERRAPRDDAGELALPENMLDSLSPLAARAAQFVKHRPEGVRTRVPKDAAAQEPYSIIPNGHHGGALLVVELGNPQKLETPWACEHRRGRGVVRPHDV